MKTGYSYSIYRIFLSVVLLFPFLSITLAQEVKIKINAPESVFTGEQFRVDYVIESDEDIKEPVIIKNMENFSILYGPSVSSSAAVRFRKGKRVVTYRCVSVYYLEAQKEGNHTLPRAEITFGGKKYKSEVVKLEVRPLKNVGDEVDAFVKTIVTKSSVNLSDTLMLTYRLYTTKEINRVIGADFPEISDFYITNITRSRQSFDEETMNGKVYKVVDLRNLILQPKQIGKVEFPKGQVTVEYSTPTGRKVRDMWGDVYNETIRDEKTLDIDSLTIRVQNLKAI